MATGPEPWFWGRLHSSWEIVGTEPSDIQGRCVALGVTGSIAAYRAVDLARKLMRMGAVVRVLMTREATRFITPLTLEWATGLPVVTQLSGASEHVAIANTCDALLIAPATLNTLADIASLHADDPVTATAHEMLGQGKPVLAVPVMHAGMWKRFSERLLRRLEDDGVYVLNPVLEEGKAKIPSIDLIAWWAEAIIARGRDLKGLRLLVTAGPTREHIDPVRVITNPSTGLMGVSIALEASFRGASVTLIHGPLCVSYDLRYAGKTIGVETSDEMAEAVLSELRRARYDVAIYAAAVADYRPEATADTKIPSTRGELVLRLVPTRKIVAEAVRASPSTIHIAFAAETVRSLDQLEAKAREKLERYGVDAIAANIVSAPGTGFASPENEVLLLARDGRKWHVPRMPKRMVARRILDVAKSLAAGR